MAVTQTALGINALGSLLSNTGLTINTSVSKFAGSSKTNSSYTPGSLINNTALNCLTYAIQDGYNRGVVSGTTLTNTTYGNLISIGNGTIPALGNSIPASFIASDSAGQWQAAGYPATTGYSLSGNTDQGQSASWFPYSLSNPNYSITQWGYLRLHALQGWNEFNWNGNSVNQSTPQFKEFCGSFGTVSSFANSSNSTIITANNASSYLVGTYSNIDDLMTNDIAGVSLSLYEFGTDLINLGNAINLSRIDAFGLPSVLLNLIINNNALIQDLIAALLISGFSTDEMHLITTGNDDLLSIDQEIKIYTAFKMITGENLYNIVSSLGCTTVGFSNLADLLNVQLLFPNSYQTLTVPMYNSVSGLSTNSKTYYLIYSNGGLNAALQSSAMKEYVGTLIPSGNPPEATNNNSSVINIGFDSYLSGILPTDQAVAAGAFGFTMQQITGIKNANLASFVQTVKNLETSGNYSLLSGTSQPANQTSINAILNQMAAGSGIYGTYTLSDFFGCMSGLPYDWAGLYANLNILASTALKNIYHELYLATTWQQATASVQYTTAGSNYTVTGVTITNPGGGYGRGNAAAPTITINGGSGATATITIGTDSTNISQFGKVININLTNAGITTTTVPTATIQTPPIDILAITNGYISNSGVNYPNGTAGWSGTMNIVVQDYINQANIEISNIYINNSSLSQSTNQIWNTFGSQLVIEQRARYYALRPVTIPKDNTLYPLMNTITNFVDSLETYALDTYPHGSAQTIEAISDITTVGGQSISASNRQSRNKIRLQEAGIDPDTNISNTLTLQQKSELLVNGTTSGAVNNSQNGYTNLSYLDNTSPLGTYTVNPSAMLGTYNSNSSGPPTQQVVQIAPPAQLVSGDPSLNSDYISGILPNSSLTPSAAIVKVTTDNCDCQIG